MPCSHQRGFRTDDLFIVHLLGCVVPVALSKAKVRPHCPRPSVSAQGHASRLAAGLFTVGALTKRCCYKGHWRCKTLASPSYSILLINASPAVNFGLA